MLGYSEAALLEKTFLDITHPEDVDRDEELSAKAFHGDIPYLRTEKRYIHKSGRIVWAELSASMVRDEEGNVLHAIGMIQDISERKEVERELERNRRLAEQRLLEVEQLYATAPVGLCTLDGNPRYVRVNETLASQNGNPGLRGNRADQQRRSLGALSKGAPRLRFGHFRHHDARIQRH